MEFEKQIQQWVLIDNQMKLLGDKMKELRNKKNDISEQINSHIETTELTNATIKINDGQLKFIKVNLNYTDWVGPTYLQKYILNLCDTIWSHIFL